MDTVHVAETDARPLPEMAYGKRKAELIVTGLEDPINVHLIKLLAVADGARADAHWRHELVTWLTKIARIRLKPSGRPAPAPFYYRILFDEPYGGTELANVGAQLGLLRRDHALRPDVDAAEIVRRLAAFHAGFARACAAGQLDEAGVTGMVEAF
jgi:hypothetical protein